MKLLHLLQILTAITVTVHTAPVVSENVGIVGPTAAALSSNEGMIRSSNSDELMAEEHDTVEARQANTVSKYAPMVQGATLYTTTGLSVLIELLSLSTQDGGLGVPTISAAIDTSMNSMSTYLAQSSQSTGLILGNTNILASLSYTDSLGQNTSPNFGATDWLAIIESMYRTISQLPPYNQAVANIQYTVGGQTFEYAITLLLSSFSGSK
jgi:hypothetical protein